jgi:hypothetical protein
MTQQNPEIEKQYYDALWRRADTNRDGRLNGMVCFIIIL